MDLEKQPLLGHVSEVRCRRLSPLTTEEVITARQEISWRRTRFCLKFMFWALMVMFLSIIACIVMTTKCNPYDKLLQQGPAVPPVHMTFAPLIYSLSDHMVPPMEDDRTYTL